MANTTYNPQVDVFADWDRHGRYWQGHCDTCETNSMPYATYLHAEEWAETHMCGVGCETSAPAVGMPTMTLDDLPSGHIVKDPE